MRRIFLILAAAFWAVGMVAQPRVEYTFQKGWKFTREDAEAFSGAAFDDSAWQDVRVPHDWAIYGPFSPDNDRQFMAIFQDGQESKQQHEGRTGGLPFVGVGWYRLDFEAPAFGEGKSASLVFDGAMSHSKVYLNGEYVGEWPYGYNSFHFDVTPFLKPGVNKLAVRLENLPSSSRWYPGAGIYRNVHLVVSDEAHVPVWGTHLTTPKITKDYATVRLHTSLEIPEGQELENYRIVTELQAADGKVVAEGEAKGSRYDEGFVQNFVMHNPELWSVDTPVLYKAVSKIYNGEKLCDEYVTSFGVRSLEWKADEGFFVNGEKVKFHGVCNHHDLGPLGTAVNEAALRYRIAMLKDMGCNAIRTSHNMPSPELVKLCDEMGMMIMSETFDEWKVPKVENGYNHLWDEWMEKDMVNVLRHYRNNPSVVMWCVGNEVSEQWDGNGLGTKITHDLQRICHREDPTRPVTLGMDAPDHVVTNNMGAVLDIPGFNYRPHKYEASYAKLPQRIILGSETASTLSARGVYKFPVERRVMAHYEDHQASSYDVEHCGWSNLPEDDFIKHDDLEYCIGEFVWTGFDYLGEPTPYYDYWPSHSSHFGIVDLAYIPKDRYYLYRSHWNPTAETLHILPHWNWEGREGEVTPVFVYTNYPTAELFINGKSQGRRTKDMTVTIENSSDEESMNNFKRQGRYRLMWMDTVYEPGTVKVVAYDEAGNPVAEKEIRTAGKPYQVKLECERTQLSADGNDIAFVKVSVVDRKGNPCPTDNRMLSFEVKGDAAQYRAAANGDASDLHMFHEPQMPLFNGRLMVLVQSTETAGDAVLTVKGKGLKPASMKINVK